MAERSQVKSLSSPAEGGSKSEFRLDSRWFRNLGKVVTAIMLLNRAKGCFSFSELEFFLGIKKSQVHRLFMTVLGAHIIEDTYGYVIKIGKGNIVFLEKPENAEYDYFKRVVKKLKSTSMSLLSLALKASINKSLFYEFKELSSARLKPERLMYIYATIKMITLSIFQGAIQATEAIIKKIEELGTPKELEELYQKTLSIQNKLKLIFILLKKEFEESDKEISIKIAKKINNILLKLLKITKESFEYESTIELLEKTFKDVVKI